MSTTLLVVVGVLAFLAIILVVYKVIKAAVFCGIAAIVIYVGYQYVLPFWETYITPYAGLLF